MDHVRKRQKLKAKPGYDKKIISVSLDQRCAGHWPNVFAKVEHVLGWIKAVIEGHPLPQNVMTEIQGAQNSEIQNSRKLPDSTLPQLHSETQNSEANDRRQLPSMQPCKNQLFFSTPIIKLLICKILSIMI